MFAKRLTFTLAFVLACAGSSVALATDGTWNVNSNGNWSDTANWVGSTVANGIDSTATLGNVITADRTITLDIAPTIGNISMLDTSHNYILSNTNPINFNTTGGTSVFNVATANRRIQFAGTVAVTGNVSKTGAGVIQLQGTGSNWVGTTTVSAGLLDFGNINIDANIGGGVGVRDITVAAGASVRFNALTNATLNRIVETTNEITVMSGSTSNNLDFSSSTGANLPNAFLGNWASNGARMQYGGTLTPANDVYRLGGAGSGGLLGVTSNLVDNGLTQRSLVLGVNRVMLVSTGNTYTGATQVRDGGRLVLGNNLAIQNSPLDVGTPGNTGFLSMSAGGGGTTGDTATPSPVLGGLIGSRNLSSVINQGSATAVANGNVGNNTNTLALNSITGLTLNPVTGTSYTYSGIIGNITGSSTALTITKTGLGTQILSGNNTYTGATSINAGTLILNGDNSAATGAVTVASLATLGGIGTIGGDTTIENGGTLSPGNSPGTMTFNNANLIFNDGGNLNWQIFDATGLAGTGYDTNSVTGTGILDLSALTGGTDFNINLWSLSSIGPDVNGNATNFDNTADFTWTLVSTPTAIANFDATDFTINVGAINGTNGFTNPLAGGSFSVGLADSNTDLVLIYTAVPEPGTLALLGGAAIAGVALLRRRRNKSA